MVLVLIAVSVLLARRHNSVRTFRLVDGREFTLMAVTYGTNHVYRSGTSLARLLAPVLPLNLKSRFGVSEICQQTAGNCVLFWGHWTGGKSRTLYPGTPAALVDSFGTTTEIVWPLPVPSASENVVQAAWKFQNFPRRENKLRFRIYQQRIGTEPELCGELAVANPAPKKSFGQWQPPSNPQTVTNADLEFTLVNFAPGFLRARYRSIWEEVASGQSALFKISRVGRPAPEWVPEFVEVSDATGNFFSPTFHFTDPIGEYNQIRFFGPLWTSENAWKLRVGFVRTSAFPSDEVVSFTDIPVHAPDHPVQITTNLTMSGAHLSEIALKPYAFLLPIRGAFRPDAQLTLKAGSPAFGWHFTLLNFKNQDGLSLPFEKGTYDTQEWRFPFKMVAGTRSVSFQLAGQSIRYVEFMSGLEKTGNSHR